MIVVSDSACDGASACHASGIHLVCKSGSVSIGNVGGTYNSAAEFGDCGPVDSSCDTGIGSAAIESTG